MDVNRSLENRVRKSGEHQRTEDLDQFPALGRQYRRAEDAVVRGIHDNLHQARGLVALDGSRHGAHGRVADLELVSFLPRFLFRHSNSTELGIGENRIGHNSVVDGQALAFDQVPVDDLEVVVGDVSEGGTALDVAQGPDARDVRLQAAIDLDEPALVGLDSCLVQVQLVGAGLPSGSDQQVRADERGRTIAPVDREAYAAVFTFRGGTFRGGTFRGGTFRGGTFRDGLLDAGCVRVQQETNAFGFQGFRQFGGHVGVLAGKDLAAALDDRDLAAKAPEHLAKLQADVTTAQHEQVFRHFAQLHD